MPQALYVNPARIHQAALDANSSIAPTGGLEQADNNGIKNPPGFRPSLYGIGQGSLIAGNAFDLGTTLKAVSSPHIKEGNPLLGQSAASISGIKALGTAGQYYLLHKLKDSGHPKLAGIAGIVAGALPTLAGIHNLKLYNSIGQ